jgi:kinesin family protein 13
VDGETFIEKYTRGVSAVETILTLDRLRQSVAVKELVAAKAKLQPNVTAASASSQFMRKTVSVPNISHVSHISCM